MDSTGIDNLTGLLDRHGCLRTAKRLTANARRSRQPLIALWLNIDRFRKINGSLGISGGDRVIAISEYIAIHASEIYGLEADRLRLVPRGVDLFRFNPDQ